MDGLKMKYFEWLVKKALGISDLADTEYLFLMKALFNKEFYWTITNDENRAIDGKELREEFAEDDDILQKMSWPCSVLELLIGLCVRVDTDIVPIDYGMHENHISDWFWELIRNLALEGCDNDGFDPEYVDYILERFLERGYESDGKGGLFPRKNADEDQTKLEIWYQMQGYFLEKYDF